MIDLDPCRFCASQFSCGTIKDTMKTFTDHMKDAIGNTEAPVFATLEVRCSYRRLIPVDRPLQHFNEVVNKE